MTKSVIITPKPRSKAQADALDAFVQGAGEGRGAVPAVPRTAAAKVLMKRLTFDIDANLHKRIRRTCLERDQDMAAEIRRILEENFPE